MPIYEFRCQGCGRDVEVWLRTSSDAATCPQCGASLRETWSVRGFIPAIHEQRTQTGRER